MTRYSSGESWRITVSVPSIPLELNTRPSYGSNTVPSDPRPVTTWAMALPDTASVTAMTWFAHTENNRRLITSIASAVGPAHSFSSHLAFTIRDLASMSTSLPGAVLIFTYTCPDSSVAIDSGVPGSGMVATTWRVPASKTERFALSRLAVTT